MSSAGDVAAAEPGKGTDFSYHLSQADLKEWSALSELADDRAVTAALGRERPGPDDLAALLSPAATRRLEELATRAAAVTRQRFGRVVRLFAPLYLSNHCLSSCSYCGFARQLSVPRRTLSVAEVADQGRVLADAGFRHLLLVAGEHRREVSPEYLAACLEVLRPLVPSVSVETQTWSRAEYRSLVAAGVEGVVHYQETYDRTRYRQVHPAGWKRDFDRRIRAVDEAGQAGVRRLGLGVLLGLAPDWRADVLALAAHAGFLARRHWRTEITLSLPRITPSASGFGPVVQVDDRQYVQSLAALRLVEPDAGIVVSTREAASLRDGLAQIAVTHMSAGSSTEPGGYTAPGGSQEQFAVTDRRSLSEVVAALAASGAQPVLCDALPLPTG